MSMLVSRPTPSWTAAWTRWPRNAPAAPAPLRRVLRERERFSTCSSRQPPTRPNIPLPRTFRQRKGMLALVQRRVWSTLRARRRARRTRHASCNPAAPPPRARRSRPPPSAPPTLQLSRLGALSLSLQCSARRLSLQCSARRLSLQCSARRAATISLASQVRSCTALLQRAC